MMVTYDNEGYLIIAVSSLRARYLTHPIDFQNLTKKNAAVIPKDNVFVKEALTLISSDIK